MGKSVSMSEARLQWADILGRVQYGHERVTIEKHGKPVAVLVPVEDVAWMDEMEDKALGEMAEEAMEEYRRTGISYSMEEVFGPRDK